MKILHTLALLAASSVSLSIASPLLREQPRQDSGAAIAGGVNICAAVVGFSNGCVNTSTVDSPLFFVCANGLQTLFTCAGGGCRQQNAANLPTCDDGQLFNGTIL